MPGTHTALPRPWDKVDDPTPFSVERIGWEKSRVQPASNCSSVLFSRCIDSIVVHRIPILFRQVFVALVLYTIPQIMHIRIKPRTYRSQWLHEKLCCRSISGSSNRKALSITVYMCKLTTLIATHAWANEESSDVSNLESKRPEYMFSIMSYCCASNHLFKESTNAHVVLRMLICDIWQDQPAFSIAV